MSARTRQRASTLAGAVLVVLVVALLRSTLAFVTTHGVSMNPLYHQGDLVVVARSSSYAVGDVVAYRRAGHRDVVLHRIVERHGDRFVFKGDNNQSTDPAQPTREDLVGRAVLHVPGGGVWVRRATSPPVLAATAFLVVAGGTATTARRRRRREERRRMSPRHRATVPSALPPALQPVAAGAVAVALLGAVTAGVAWTRPTSVAVAARTTTDASMRFSYTAHVAPSPAYDGTTVTAPQPVFRALADAVDVTYAYTGPPGRLSVAAELSTGNGWRSTVPLAGELTVGRSADGSVHLDLSALQHRADAAAEVIGVPARDVQVAVVPTVALDGGGTFAPRLQLTLDDHALASKGDLMARDTAATTGSRRVPARTGALGASTTVRTARVVGLAALVLALLALAALAVVVRVAGPVVESERVRRRHGSVLLPVLRVALPAGKPVVDVPDVDALVRLAERYGLLVLTWSRGGVDTYVVQDEGTTYRYRSGVRDDVPVAV